MQKDMNANDAYKENRKFIEKISREVDSLPEWKKNTSGFSSNYCSELQPLLPVNSDFEEKLKKALMEGKT